MTTGTVPGPGPRADIATAALRREILCGHLYPGARVHLQEASERLQMSPGPVREALRTLAGEGLVIALPQRGYRVSPLSRTEFEDVYRWRMELDPTAARDAAEHMSDAQRAAMRDTLSHWREAFRQGNWDEFNDYHREFHVIAYEACSSAWLRGTAISLWDASLRYQVIATRSRDMEEYFADQESYMEALAARDGDLAAEIVTGMLQRTVEVMKGQMLP